jgi:hypothetical protein
MYVSPRWKNFLLVAASLAAGLIMAEVLLRVISVNPRKINHRDFYDEDPILGWKKKSHAIRRIQTPEFTALEQTNSRGLRGEEYHYEKAPEEFRILILGDSFAEGYTANFEQLFSELLRRSLNERRDGRVYQVINAGTVGYGTDQELLFFEIEGKKYSPDVVLLLFYENDVVENVSIGEMYGKHKKLFQIRDGQLFLKDEPTVFKDKAHNEGSVRTQVPKRSLLKQSALYNFAREHMARFGVLTEQDSSSDCDLRFFEVVSAQDSKEMNAAWKVTELILQRLRDSVATTGAHLVVFYIPSVYALDPLVWAATAKKFGLVDKEWDLLKPEIRLKGVCERLRIPFESLADSFRQKARELGVPSSAFYHVGDGHWNVFGHRHVSEIMGKFLDTFPFSESLEP